MRSMQPDSRLIAGHTPDFVAAWRSAFCDVYRWRQEGRFAVVPQLFGAPVFSYLPGLSYADLNATEARVLAREMAGRSFNIRALAAPEGDPPPGAPAVLRLDLAAFGHDRDVVWEQALNGATRRAVRRACKAGLEVAEETGPAAVAVFRGLLSATLARHGLAQAESFAKFGLTDTAIVKLVKDQFLVLTDDFPLSNYLGKQGVDVLNFNHLRFASWR